MSSSVYGSPGDGYNRPDESGLSVNDKAKLYFRRDEDRIRDALLTLEANGANVMAWQQENAIGQPERPAEYYETPEHEELSTNRAAHLAGTWVQTMKDVETYGVPIVDTGEGDDSQGYGDLP